MPDLLTPATIASAGPLLIDTLLKHFLSRKSLTARSKARGDDLMYDEAFVLMKTFLESSTKYPVASLQKFGQVRTPAPPTVSIFAITIPYNSLASAADYLVKAFGGEEMAFKIAGGSKWWQVRAGAGVEAEWIVMRKDFKEYERGEKERKRSMGPEGGSGSGSRTPKEGKGKGKESVGSEPEVDAEEDEWRSELDDTRCMLYIHGGAYYWGSINTHRYTIWRYARKMRGRCFAVNYRKAPQYPFPCAIQDCLAAYIYLTRPPPGAKHKPVKPEHMVIAGDSAGGGLVLALLQILRDTEGLELPAGAVLISPWSDLTHSFPSILHNTSTDIVPPYSFIHKPSSLWPPPPPDVTNIVQSRLKTKIKEFTAHLHTDSPTSSEPESANPVLNIPLTGRPADLSEKLRSSQLGQGGQKKKFSLLNFGKVEPALHPTTNHLDPGHQPDPDGERNYHPSRANPAGAFSKLQPRTSGGAEDEKKKSTTLANMEYPIELDVQGEQVVIDTQIQLYATNAQLCYPLISPVLGYMGGLCPLYICAGDNEVLRDEIIYLAHKAANPEKYPIREDVRAMMPHYEGIESRYGPTKVHLQVFDGTGHDLPLFSMCKSARGVFRAISTFARQVTPTAGIMPTSSTSSSSTPGQPFPGFSMTPLGGLSRRNSTKRWSLSGPAGGSGSSSPKPNSVKTMPIQDLRITTEPETTTKSASTSSSVSNGKTRLGELGRVESPLPMSPAPISPTSRPVLDDSLHPVPGVSFDKDPIREDGTGLGDDAGPRWGGFEDDNNSAKPGEAGHPSIYRGPDAYRDNMIRERVNIHGILRPLEPNSELGAMTMPSDEIGTIKEGPAMRYLTGQYLWDKKYKRARKEVEKHREKNLREARSKDGERIGRGIKGLYEEHHKRRAEVGEGEGDEHWSWSWDWALDGEIPPPSAIVSRRDTSEARKLALMADRLDSAHHNPIGGLSIWVALATFFSNVGEKEKASETLRQAKEKRKGSEVGSEDSVDGGTDGEDTAGATDDEVEQSIGGEKRPETGRRGSAMGKLGHALGLK